MQEAWERIFPPSISRLRGLGMSTLIPVLSMLSSWCWHHVRGVAGGEVWAATSQRCSGPKMSLLIQFLLALLKHCMFQKHKSLPAFVLTSCRSHQHHFCSPKAKIISSLYNGVLGWFPWPQLAVTRGDEDVLCCCRHPITQSAQFRGRERLERSWGKELLAVNHPLMRECLKAQLTWMLQCSSVPMKAAVDRLLKA